MTPQPQLDYFLPTTLTYTCWHCERNHLFIYPYDVGIKFCIRRQTKGIIKSKLSFSQTLYEIPIECENCDAGRALRGLKPRKYPKLVTSPQKRCHLCKHNNGANWCFLRKRRGKVLCDDFEWREK